MPGFPGYFVTDAGAIYSRVQTQGHWAKRLSVRKHRGGYRFAEVIRDGKRTHLYVHRAVALAFHGLPPAGQPEARHLDGDLANNCAANIAWGSHRENMADRTRHGRNPKGRRNGRAKLDEAKVAVIRTLVARGRTMPAVARHFGVDTGTVADIVDRTLWPDVAASNDDAAESADAAIAEACARDVAALEAQRSALEGSLVFDELPLEGDLAGRRSGRLTLVVRAEADRFGHEQWRVRCNCGTEIVVRVFMMRQRRAASCGCLGREVRAIATKLRYASGMHAARRSA